MTVQVSLIGLCTAFGLGLAATSAGSATPAAFEDDLPIAQPRTELPAPSLALGVERRAAEAPVSVLQCFQHGVRIVDEEIDGTRSVPPARPDAGVLQAIGGARLHLVAFEHTFCIVRQRSPLPPRRQSP